MTQIVSNRFWGLMQVPTIGKVITSSLLISLVSTLGMPLSSQPSLAAAETQSPSSLSTKAVTQLLGQWQAKDPASGKVLTLIFAPEEQLLIVLPPRAGTTAAIKMGYQINPTTQPMQLDMKVSRDQVAATIFELTQDGKLRLELAGVSPGNPRPANFTNTAVLFEKVSNVTTVPKDVQVVAIETQKATPRPNIAEQYLTILGKAQQAYFLKKGKFAASLEELGIISSAETELYRYQIVPQGDRTNSVMITAQAKTAEVPSYTGTVYAAQINGKRTPLTVICATNRPSTSPPTMPNITNSNASAVQCPAGSSLVR
jgi:hypothetical protein